MSDNLPHYRGAGSDTRPTGGPWRQRADTALALLMAGLVLAFLAIPIGFVLIADALRGRLWPRARSPAAT